MSFLPHVCIINHLMRILEKNSIALIVEHYVISINNI